MWKPAKQKSLEKIRSRWGKPRPDLPHLPPVAAWSDADAAPSYHRLNEQTTSDIDFHKLFRFTDHTTSRIGQQTLYHRLLRPRGEATALNELDNQARFFTDNTPAREKAQQLLLRLDHPDAYSIHLLMGGKLFTRPGWYPLALADTIIVIALLLLSIPYPVLLIWAMLPFAINIVLHLRNKNNTFRYIKALPQLNVLINTTRKLAATDIPFDQTGLTESFSQLKGFQRKIRWLSFGNTQGSELAMLYFWLLELFKALFLIELHSFFRLIRELEQSHGAIHRVFTYTGQIDLAISVASLRAAGGQTCIPTLSSPVADEAKPSSTKHLRVRDLYHPLIKDCVVNSLDIYGRGILITGSNMSGKTTFLRTLGINSLLAQTLYTCYGTEYTAPPFRLYSSIRIDDSLLDGKSYYFEEVNVMGELIAASGAREPNLYLLDEVFKGTNMVERIASAKAILSYLDRKGHIVVVSTHDLELADMLKENYDLYHFEEILQDGQLLFDHLLKAGPLKTRNAIRILGLADYPEEIIRDASETSRRLTEGRE
jgi:DNA mismatch repair ATPase MutS